MAGDNPDMPISTTAVNWLDSAQQLHLHVFSCDGYTVTQRYSDPTTNGWTTGALNEPASFVSATAWTMSGSGSIRVYCTSDDATTEWCLDGGGAWYQGSFTTE